MIIAEKIVLDLITLFREDNIILSKIYFKQINQESFEYLLIINNEQFLLDNYSIIYKSAHLIKNRHLNQGLNVDFSFLGDKELVDESVFTSEGWIIGSYINEINA
jgi:hypothetical protein